MKELMPEKLFTPLNIIGFLMGFFIILSKPVSTLITAVIFFFWLFKESKDKKIVFIKDPITISFLIYFFVLIISFFLSDNKQEAFYVLRKHRWIILFPSIYWFVKNNISSVKWGYITSCIITVLFSYTLYFGKWVPYLNIEKDFDFFCPYHHHVEHGILISFGLFLFMHHVLSVRRSIKYIISISIPVLLVIYNIFFTQGRMGQLVLVLSIFFLFIFRFRKYPVKAFIYSSITIIVLLSVTYLTVEEFSHRIDDFNSQVKAVFESNDKYTVGKLFNYRMWMWVTCYDIWKDNIIFGTGTGDFPKEYEERFEKLYPKSIYIGFVDKYDRNPHNYHIQVLARTGLIGVFSWIFIFYILLRKAFVQKHYIFCIYLIIAYLMMNLTDIYFQKHIFQLLFFVMISFCFLIPENREAVYD